MATNENKPRPWPQMYADWPWPNGIPHAAEACTELSEEELFEQHFDDRDPHESEFAYVAEWNTDEPERGVYECERECCVQADGNESLGLRLVVP